MEASDRSFLSAGAIAVGLVSRHEVEQRWERASVLPQMTVGMLACHLGRQLVRVRDLVPVRAVDKPLDGAAAHYRRAAWVTAESLDDPANDRSHDEREAAAGFDSLRDRCRQAISDVDQILTSGEAAAVVTIPWQGWSLWRADFLLTRLVEIVVHADDLARSIGVATPEFPEDVYRAVLHLLADLAVERHGQAAMTSALTRSERMPATISVF